MSKLKTLFTITFIYILGISYCKAMVIDRAYLTNFIKNYIEKNITIPANAKRLIEVSSIDPRISLQPCFSPLIANIPEKHNGRNVNVKVICPDKKTWYLFVPVRIEIIVPILVAKVRMTKGTLLNMSNMEVVFKSNAQIRGTVLTDATVVTGARTKRNLSKGSAITNKNVCFVCKGQSVNIMARSSNFEIRSSGVALQDGSLGEIISVKNEKSGRIVRGQVNAINEVVINL